MKDLYQTLTKRENLFYFLLLIFPIVFPKYLSSLFDKYINDLIFNNIHSSPLTDFVFLLIGILFIIPCFLKLQFGYHFNRTKIILLFILSFWYLQIRCNIAWSFTSFYYYEGIKYSDVPLMIAGFNILCFLIIEIKRISLKEILTITYLSILRLKLKSVKRGVILILRLRRNKSNNIVLNRFIPERINTEQDILGRTDYANSIAENIANSYPTEKESYAIAITGKWGSGKTTILKLIQKVLIEQGRIVIEFHPWRNHESKNLINNFFDLLNNELGEYDPQLGNKLALYAKQLVSVEDNSFFKSIDFVMRTIFGSLSIDELYEQINNSLSKIDKQIIITVDDIDRLDAQELIEVIKLIRSSSNFKNLVFLVAYDKEYVINTLREQSKYNMNDYLEKIILAEFNIPSYEPERLIMEFKNELLISFDNPNYKKSIEDYFKFQTESVNTIVKQCITSVRDIRRFTNAFKVTYSLIKENVVFGEFLNLELIKFKHKSIYDFIENNHHEFCEEQQNLGLFDERQYNIVPIRQLNVIELSKLWENNVLVANKDMRMVSCLFSFDENHLKSETKNNYRKNRLIDAPNSSIRNGINIINYFGYRITDSQIGNEEFRKILFGSSELWNDKLKIWENNYQFEQVTKHILSIESIASKEQYKAIQNFIILLRSKSNIYSERYRNLLMYKYWISYSPDFKEETIEILNAKFPQDSLLKNEFIEYIYHQIKYYELPTNEFITSYELSEIYKSNCKKYLEYLDPKKKEILINLPNFISVVKNSSLLDKFSKDEILRKMCTLDTLNDDLAVCLVEKINSKESFNWELYHSLFDHPTDFDTFMKKVNPRIRKEIQMIKDKST